MIIALDVFVWAAVHTVTGYAAHRVPDRVLDHDHVLLRLMRFEAGGRWYRRWLRVDRWKDALPDAGGLFRGISKRHLPSHDAVGLAVFAREARRAEVAHWSALCCSPVFALWNPPLATAVLMTYGVVVNAPFIVIQRFNRARLHALTMRRRR